MPTTIAVPGGLGKIGLPIVEVLQDNPKYNVIVLSRQKPEGEPKVKAPIIAVNYNDLDALTKTLEEHQVHTVISTLNVVSPETSAAELNLVEAANANPSTKRFISSTFATPPSDKFPVPGNAIREATAIKLRKTDLEWTTIHSGFIMDCLGTPYVKSSMGVYTIHVDMPHRKAAVPGSGNDRISFSYSYDIARFVEAALSLEKWEEDSYCYSDNRTFNEVIQAAEEATGSKFDVTYDPIEKLERGEMTELPGHKDRYPLIPKAALQRRFTIFGLFYINGLMHMPEDKTLNHKFPEIETRTVENIMSGWKGH